VLSLTRGAFCAQAVPAEVAMASVAAAISAVRREML